MPDDPRIRALDPDSPTIQIAEDLAAGGSMIEVGGTDGGIAVALAGRGHRVTSVVGDEVAAREIRDDARRARVNVTCVVGSWPVVARNAGPHDVSLCAHSLYGVANIGGFVEAMHTAARRAVVVELTPNHPGGELSKYFERLHDLPRRQGPSADDFADVVSEVVGVEPQRRWWEAPRLPRFADEQDLLAYYRRRLDVPPVQSIDAAALLERDIQATEDGWLVLGPPQREIVTMWWSTRR